MATLKEASKSARRGRAFSAVAPVLCNQLPVELCLALSRLMFRKLMKTWLFREAFQCNPAGRTCCFLCLLLEWFASCFSLWSTLISSIDSLSYCVVVVFSSSDSHFIKTSICPTLASYVWMLWGPGEAQRRATTRTFSGVATSPWNSLPPEVRLAHSLLGFRRQFMAWLFSQAFLSFRPK